MKVLVNGGLNLSELDGWWAEAYSPDVGWALGDGNEHGEDPAWDANEAQALYDILEKQVIPEFYNRDKNGIPTDWVVRMRASMSRLTVRFSANRAVREYTEKYYLPAAASYLRRASDRGAVGALLLKWKQNLARHWMDLHFGDLRVESSAERHSFHVQVYFGGVDPDAVRVELYAEPLYDEPAPRLEMSRGNRLTGSMKGYNYSTEVPASRSATDYTPRIIASHPAARVPLEEAHILWFR